ncbi:MAG: HEAT repeat domain-containing protein [Deltaproteobacteria bacterium]|nr:HEAT repeat domain-containing protein [Deltaproteobacteria bacterium]
MDTNVNENSTGGFDAGLLATVIHELNLARRYVSSYPKGHPVVSTSCERAADMFARLFSTRDEITIGVAKETLLLGADSLDRLTPVVKGVARILFHHGIALISFRKGLTAGEIEKFNEILLSKRGHIAAGGGIEKLVPEAGIEHLQIRRIRYDSFQVSDDLSDSEQRGRVTSSIWESFVRRVMQNELSDSGITDDPVAPEDLAEFLNSKSGVASHLIAESLVISLLEGSGLGALSAEERESLRKIGSFVGRLNPELRRRFLDGVFNSFQGREDAALEILPHLSEQMFSAVIEYMDESKATLSPLALSVVERLTDGSGAFRELRDLAGRMASLSDEAPDKEIQAVFREEDDEEFVPREYLETLKALVATREIPEPACDELARLKQTLSSDQIESSVSRIILASLGLVTPERSEALKRSLAELRRYFLEVGDFRALEDMYNRLQVIRLESGHAAGALKEEVLEAFQSAEFVAEVLNGLDVWGKEKYCEIGSLIQRVGGAFVEPLLDRLADEQNRTLRRYCLDQLLKMANLARESVLARLGDRRWYVVRNLVVILQHTGDPAVPALLAGVADFPHPKVRQIVMETYLRFHHPEGILLLLHDLTNDDVEVRLQAIQHAGKCGDPRVRAALVKILGKKGLAPELFKEKKAVIQTLARIGSKDSLPVLEKMLAARHFLRRSLHLMLKKEIVFTLGKYADPFAISLLRKTAASSNRGLSGLASEVIMAMERENE